MTLTELRCIENSGWLAALALWSAPAGVQRESAFVRHAPGWQWRN